MVSMGYNISHTEIYNLLMVTIAARNEVQAVRDLFARMTSQNIPKTTLTYNTYLKVLAQHSTLKEMVSVFKQMQADKSGVQPDAETFNIFINYFAQTAEWTRMNQFYDLLVSSNIQPSEHTFEIILSAMQKRKLRAIWKYYYKFVSTRRQVSSNKIFKIVLQMWAGFPLTNKVTDFVKSISEDMKRLNAPITHSMFHEIMQYGQDEGHWRIVKNAYHFMVHCFGLKPTEETMKIMGTGTLVVTSNWREAVPWYLRELQ
jgi:pentatricopeptide repeat protein